MSKQKTIEIPDSYKYIAAFLTMNCNLSCSFCLNDFGEILNRKGFHELSGEEWVKALNRIESRENLPITFCGGEPFLHKDFIYIINNLKPELNIDILTNLYIGDKGLERFISEVDPKKINRKSKYASIRVSYHPEQMEDGKKLVENVRKFKDAGFDIGIYGLKHPDPMLSAANTQMQFRCIDSGINYREKDFTGKYEGFDDIDRPFSITHGDYSKYPNSILEENTKNCMCKTSELLIGPKGDIYKCHRDLYAKENSIGDITNLNFQIEDIFRRCNQYGQCNPCDVKLKTNYKQELKHTSVEIKEIQST